MGNYQGKLNTLRVYVAYDNPKPGLVKIIDSLDSDYEEYSEKIADNIINDPKNDGDVVSMIDALLLGHFGEVMEYSEEFGKEVNVLDDISTFLLQNCTYCESYEFEIQHIRKGEQLILSYIT
jgi:hypothetical protein